VVFSGQALIRWEKAKVKACLFFFKYYFVIFRCFITSANYKIKHLLQTL